MEKTVDKKYDSGTGAKFNLHFMLLCLCGQLCWNVENQWFNTFLYRKITTQVEYVTAMVILSATLTCISTYLFGAISDRKGNRKKFMGWGYIIWGITTLAVGLTEYLVNDTRSNLAFVATMVVLLDGVMSFIGSIAYDGSFNAWTNDHTTTKNKGFIGFIYGIMPVIATIFGTLVGGMIITNKENPNDPNYIYLFVTIAALVIVTGILTLIFVKDSSRLKPSVEGSLWNQATQSFRLKSLSKMPNFKEMLFACLVICVYFISFNFYFVHLGNWALYTLGFKQEMDFGIIEGVSMIVGILVAVPCSKLIDKNHIPLVCFLGLGVSLVGLIICTGITSETCYTPEAGYDLFEFIAKNWKVMIACFFFGTGDILMTEACMIWVRGLFPDEKNGQFEGIRCIFFVWLPMLIGTICGQVIIRSYNDLHQIGQQVGSNLELVDVPPADLFKWATFVVVAAIIPLIFGTIEYKKRIKAQQEALKNGVVDRTLFDAIPEEE